MRDCAVVSPYWHLRLRLSQTKNLRGHFFSESFENARLLERGWYDGSKFTISSNQPFADKGCIEYPWKTGGTPPANSSGLEYYEVDE